MTLLAEYALTPDVFDSTSYSNTEVSNIHLQYLKEVLLNEALVRNLRNGTWLTLFSGDHRSWNLRGKELLQRLITQKRLRVYPSCLANDPITDCEWCQEAITSHEFLPLLRKMSRLFMIPSVKGVMVVV